MKTPKRKYETNFLEWGDEHYGLLSPAKKEHFSRWKRKNRVAQLKRTIARLTQELQQERQKCVFFMLPIPALQKNLTLERNRNEQARSY